MFLLPGVLFGIVGSISTAVQVDASPLIRAASEQAKVLGAQLGKRVEVSPELKQIPVLMIQRNGDANIMLNGLAYALHATLTNEGTAYRISRTNADRKAIKAADVALMTEKLQHRLDAWDADIKHAAAFGRTAAQVAHFIETDAHAINEFMRDRSIPLHRDIDPALLTPAGHLLRGLIKKITPQVLAGIGPDEVKVFSNSPNALELAVDGDQELVQIFEKEQAFFQTDSALHVSEADRNSSLESVLLPDPNLSLDGLQYLLTIIRHENIVDFELNVYNAAGRFVATSFIRNHPERDNELSWQHPAIVAGQQPKAIIDLDPIQATYYQESKKRRTGLAQNDPYWQQLLNPEKFDPTNELVPAALKPALDVKILPVIGVVPDSLIFAASYAVVQGTKINTAAFDALFQETSEWADRDGVTFLIEKDPLESEKYITDRASLGSALRRFNEIGQVDLRGWSVLELQDGAAFHYVSSSSVRRLESKGLPEFLDTNVWNLLFQLIGQIPDDIWRNLRTDLSVKFEDPQSLNTVWTGLAHERAKLADFKHLAPIYNNPTKMFAHGLRSVRLILHRDDEMMLKPGEDPRQLGLVAQNLQSWVQDRHRLFERKLAGGQSAPTSENASLEDSVKNLLVIPCRRSSIAVTLELPNGITISKTFRDSALPESEATHFDGLPQEFRTAIASEWVRLETLRTNGGSGDIPASNMHR